MAMQEDAERLAALAETIFRRTAAAHPRAFRQHGGMVDADAQLVVTVAQGVGHVERPDSAAHQLAGILTTVERDGGVSAHTLKLQEVALAALLLTRERFIIFSRAVQVAVAQLAVAVVVVEVVGEVHFLVYSE